MTTILWKEGIRMSKNEILARARQLDKKYDYETVVSLLENYIKDHTADKELLALYYKNFTWKTLIEEKLNVEKMNDESEARFQGLSDENAFRSSALSFMNYVATIYLRDGTEEEKKKLVSAIQSGEISSLGARLNDYERLKKQLEAFYETRAIFGYNQSFYKDLCRIVNCKSTVSKNILRYIVERVTSTITVASDEEIYDEYTKNMSSGVFPFEEMPSFITNLNVKTEEAERFWKGYFSLAIRIRQKEYDDYERATADETHEKYDAYMAGEYIRQSRLNLMVEDIVSPEDVAKCYIEVGFEGFDDVTSGYDERLSAAKRLFNRVELSPFDRFIIRIKAFVNKLLDKK